MLLFLFLQAILKLTEAGSDSFLNLEKAIKAIHEVLLYHCWVFFSECNWTTQWCHCVLLPDSDWVWQGGPENEMYRGAGLPGAANWFWQSQGDNFLDSSLRFSKELFLFCNLWMAVKLTAASSFQSVPLVISGRFLVHKGSVRQLTVDPTYCARASFISIYIHLFNDLLIISSKKYLTLTSAKMQQMLFFLLFIGTLSHTKFIINK